MKRMSWLQWATHIGSLIPLVWLSLAALTNHLTVNPIQRAEQLTGDIAIILLWLSLACTPVNILSGYHQVIKLGRPLGLYAFLYTSIHLIIFMTLDYGLDFGLIYTTVIGKPYLIAGFGAFFLLVPLAVTSIRWWIKKMGKWWKRLHRFVYLIGVVVVLHYAWAAKGDLFHLRGDILKPFLATITLAIMLIVRIPAVRRWIIAMRRRLSGLSYGGAQTNLTSTPPSRTPETRTHGNVP